MAMHQVVRKNLVDNSRRVLYQTPDLDDAHDYLAKNHPRVHVEMGEPVEEFEVVEGDADEDS